jgi:NADH dehydrogenase
MATRVLIVGGGYVAVWAHRAVHRRLRRRMRRGELTTTIVAPGLSHRFHGFTGEVLGGVLPPQRVATALADLCPLAELIDGTVTSVDLAARQATVVADRGGTMVLDFDQLVLAAGSSDSQFPAGIAEHGHSTKNPVGFEALRQRLDEPWEDIVVVGGGLAGVELCAAIAERFTGGGARPAGGRRIHLVHSGDTLVPELLPRYRGLSRYVRRQLDGYGVRVRTGTAVLKVTATGVDLDDDTSLPADVVVSTSGQRPVAIPGTESLDRHPDGRLRVDGYLNVSGHAHVWSGGDVAAVPHLVSGKPSPANALWAIKHGAHLGRNLARVLRGRRPRRFAYLGLGRAASMGLGKGVAHLYGVPFTGWTAWLTRAAFFLIYMPSRRQAVAAAGELFAAVRSRGRH